MRKAVVGQGSCGLAAGAGEIYATLLEYRNDTFSVGITGCVGMCFLEPIVDIYEDEALIRRLVKVKTEQVPRIAAAISTGQWEALDKFAILPRDEAFLAGQTRIALRNCGLVDPTDIGDYIARGGYAAARRAISSMTPEEILQEIRRSGLAGRGGAGFPTWKKWAAVRASGCGERYLICNGDEGDPGAFMDRALLESDPHGIIEGMLIAARAMECRHMLIYVRAEYPLAVSRIHLAIAQAKERGFWGEHLFGTDFSCDLHLRTGAGAFVCGEETALIASLEGCRGMPSPRPPYPAQRGYLGASTCINNVETLANVPWILQNGGGAMARIGTERSKGTKVFALAGKVRRGGLVEVPMGTPLREIVFGLGGGAKGKRAFKAIQLGGPSGGFLPESMLDTPVDYDALAETGAIMGSGGLVVMDEATCMVEMARFFLQFTAAESCGKCVPCRIGTRQAFEILSRMTQGQGWEADVTFLEELCDAVGDGALCGLGKTALNPVRTILRYFRQELTEHVTLGRCAAHQCLPLLNYQVVPKLCRNCRLCLKSCPVNCIVRIPGKVFLIDQERCIKCDACPPFCPFDAIVITTGGDAYVQCQ